MTRFLDALITVPRVDAAQWSLLSPFTRWAIAARASVLAMTLGSAGIGGLLAVAMADFDPWLWLVTTLGLLAAHATNNLVNDFVDSARGLDSGDYHRARYGTHVLAAGLMSRAQLLRLIACTAAPAIAAGVIAVIARGGLTLPLTLAGAFFVLFYTWPLKSLGLGEPAVLVVWGPLMTGGTYYVACGSWSWGVAALGAVYALGPTAVLFGKHIDKIGADAARGIRTLPVMIGERVARKCAIVMLALQVAVPPVLGLAGLASPWLLLCLLALPRARRAIAVFSRLRPAERPADFSANSWPLWYAPHAFAVTRRLSALMLLALAIDLFA